VVRNPTHDRTGRGSEQRRHGEIGCGPDQLVSIHALQKHEASDRNHHRSTEALDHARQGEKRQALAKPAEDRAQGEYCDCRPKHAPGAKAIRRPAADRNEQAEAEHVDRNCKADIDRAGA